MLEENGMIVRIGFYITGIWQKVYYYFHYLSNPELVWEPTLVSAKYLYSRDKLKKFGYHKSESALNLLSKSFSSDLRHILHVYQLALNFMIHPFSHLSIYPSMFFPVTFCYHGPHFQLHWRLMLLYEFLCRHCIVKSGVSYKRSL